MIDNSNFEQSKSEFSGGASFLIEGVPIEGFANFTDFEEARSREFSRNEFNLTEEESALYVAQFVPSRAFQAYEACLRVNAQQNYGLHLIPKEVTPEFVSMDLLWNSPPPVQTANLEFEIFGGQPTRPLPTDLRPSSYLPISLTRAENTTLRVIASANGFQPVRLTVPFREVPASANLEPYEMSGYEPDLEISAHIQTAGDISGSEGRWVGSRGQSRRLEGFHIELEDEIPGLDLEYMCHVQSSGDSGWTREGNLCGTRGEGRRLEGLAIRLTGDAAQFFDVEYQCHIQGQGDSQILRNGQFCGTRGQSRRLEAFIVTIRRK